MSPQREDESAHLFQVPTVMERCAKPGAIFKAKKQPPHHLPRGMGRLFLPSLCGWKAGGSSLRPEPKGSGKKGRWDESQGGRTNPGGHAAFQTDLSERIKRKILYGD